MPVTIRVASDNWGRVKFTGAVASAAAVGLTTAAERLKALSVPLTPYDQGPLSAATSVIPASAGKLEARVHNDTVYAARQHEELGYRHMNGRQAKYLEAPAEQNAEQLMALVSAAIRRSLR